MENKINVLILEDNEDDAFLLVRELKKGGYIVDSVRIDNEARLKQVLVEREWDIVFTDYLLPQYSGISALKYIKEQKPDLPCIMLSGKFGEESAVEAMKAGASDYIMKNNYARLLPAMQRELKESGVRRDKKQIEAELHERQIQYSVLFDTANDAIVLLDENVIIDCNRTTEMLFGYGREEMLGKHPWDFSPPNQPTGNTSELDAGMWIGQALDGNSQYFEWVYRKKDGSDFLTEISLNRVILSDRKILMALIRDITARKADEEKLRRSEEKYRQLFSQMYSGFAIIEMLYGENGQPYDCRILETNPGFTRHTGLAKEEVIHKHFRKVFPSIRQSHINSFNEMIRTDIPMITELYLDNLNKYIDLRAYKLDSRRFAIIFHDVTKRKMAEKNHELAAQILEILNKPNEQKVMIEQIIGMFRNYTSYQAVAIRMRENDSFPLYFQLGFTDRFLNQTRYAVCRIGKGECNAAKDCCKCYCGYILSGNVQQDLEFITRNGSLFINDAMELIANSKKMGEGFEMRDHCLNEGFQSLALIPLRFDGEIIGLLQIADERPNCFSTENIQFYESLAVSIGIAINRVRSREEIRLNELRLSSLLRISELKADSVQELVAFALNEALQLTRSEAAMVLEFDSASRSFKLPALAVQGQSGNKAGNPEELFDPQLLADRALAGDKPMIINSPDTIKTFVLRQNIQKEKISRLMMVPVLHTGTLNLLICMINKHEDFTEVDFNQVRLMMEFVMRILTQKQLDINIRENEEKLRAIIDSSADAISIADEECRIVEWNHSCELLFDIPREEAVGRYSWDIDLMLCPEKMRTPEVLESFRQRSLKISREGAGWWGNKIQDVNIETPRGRMLTIQSRVYSIKTTRGYMTGSVMRDVTDLIAMQAELVETKELYQKFLDSTSDYAYVKDASLRYLMVNETFCQFAGKQEREIIGRTDAEILGGRNLKINEATDLQVLKSREMIVFDENHGERYFERRKFPVKLTQNATGIGGYIRDITQVVKSREEEKKNLQMLDMLSKTAMEFVKLDIDEDVYNFVADGLHRMVPGSLVFAGTYDAAAGGTRIMAIKGLNKSSVDELVKIAGVDIFGRNIPIVEKYYHSLLSEKLERLSNRLQDILSPLLAIETIGTMEQYLNVKEVFGIGLVDQNQLFGLITIVNTRNNVEINKVLVETYINQASVALQKNMVLKELQDNERRIRDLIGQSNDIIFTLDTDENLTSINPIGEKLITGKFGGKTPVMEFVPEETFIKVKTAFINAYKRHKNYIVQEIDLVSRTGALITLEVNLSAYLKNNKIYEVFGIARNITRSKLMQNQVLSLVIEAEERQKKMFAEELHDGLGSLLSTINIYVGLLQKKNKTQQERDEYLENLRKLVHEAVSNVRFFVNSMTPNVLNDFGLVRAVKIFCDKINTTSKGLITFTEPAAELQLNKIIEINFYRIVLELINNSMKYSQAGEINIVLEDLGDKLALHYSDNGKGFDLEQVMNAKVSGMGVKNIHARINSLNGKCEFASSPGGGTRVTATVHKNLDKVLA